MDYGQTFDEYLDAQEEHNDSHIDDLRDIHNEQKQEEDENEL